MAAKADNGLYSSDDDRSELGRCPRVPDGYCAVLYDDENCEGWSYVIPTGAFDLPEELRNDAEIVVVKSRCKFTGTTYLTSIGFPIPLLSILSSLTLFPLGIPEWGSFLA